MTARRARTSRHRLLTLPFRAIGNWFRHGNPTQSAALAFYTIFSLLPTLFVGLYLSSLFVEQQTMRDLVSQQVELWAGADTAAGIDRALAATIDEPLPIALGGWNFGWLALAAFLLGATAFYAQLEEALNHIWGTVEERKVWRILLRQRFVAGVLMLGVGALLVVLALVAAVLQAVNRVVPTWLPSLPLFELASIGLLFLAMTWIFRALPARRVRWRAALGGGAATTLLLWLSRVLFSGFLGTASSAMLGATTSVVGVLLWVYAGSMIVLLGGEVTYLLDEELPRR